MKKLILISLVFLTPLLSRARQADTTKIGDTAPAFNFSISKDQKVNIKDYRGKIVVINFFATWCAPCQLELPRVQKEIWEKYKDNPKFSLFIFGLEQGWNAVLSFKEKNQYTFFMLPDKGRKVFSHFKIQSIPRNVVLDEDGKIIYQSVGYSEKDFNELLNLLAERLK